MCRLAEVVRRTGMTLDPDAPDSSRSSGEPPSAGQ
jgi:hypothetical protein